MQDIKDYISYNPDTGVFTRLKTSGGCIPNSIVGTKQSAGYIRLRVKRKLYLAHRLAWWFVYGKMPDHNIDHINGVRDDNRICNLRLDTDKQNQQNITTLSKNNKSGFAGVSWSKRMNKWRADIYIEGKSIYLGNYDTPEEASAAYLCAKKKHHPFWVEKLI